MRLNGFWKDIPIRRQIKTGRTEKNTNERIKGAGGKKRAEGKRKAAGRREGEREDKGRERRKNRREAKRNARKTKGAQNAKEKTMEELLYGTGNPAKRRAFEEKGETI
jgi:hypothetical protein